MILKIARYTNDKDWWVVDNVEKISIGKSKTRKAEDILKLDLSNWDINILDYTLSKEGYEEVDTKELICRTDYDSEFNILFDTCLYLLNNHGHTIEKIQVN